MDLQTVHFIIDLELRKSGGNGFIPPERKDLAINLSQIEYFEKIKPAYETNQQMDDALQPFKAEYVFTNGTSANGLITFPTNYFHLLSVETVVTDSTGTYYIPVELVGEDEISIRRNDQLCPVTLYYPIGMLKAGGTNVKTFQIYPQSASAGTVYYLRRPVDCQFVYTQSGRSITYNAGSSIQLEWNDAAIVKIIARAVQYLSLNVQDGSALQFNQEAKQ